MKKLLLVLFLVSAIKVFPQSVIDKKVNKENLIATLEFLTSDLLEGRETPTNAEKVSALFLATTLKKYGIEPFGDDGTYFQNFDVSVEKYEFSSKLVLTDSKGAVIKELLPAEDFGRFSRSYPDPEYSIQNTKIVFAGYGITALEYKYDDYKDIDVKGKTVVIFMDEPYNNDDGYFDGTKKTKYSEPDYKAENAASKGALGIIIIANPEYYAYWDMFKKYTMLESVSIYDKEKTKSKTIPIIALSKTATETLFDNEEFALDQLQEYKKSGKAPSPFQLDKKIDYKLSIYSKIKKAANVIGIIKGQDEKLAKEYVVLSAHYDHIGTDSEGVVNNGADDDGSGTVSILEAGRVLSLKKDNDRSILIAFHTGEEKGLLGSSYLTEHSDFTKDIIANINMDMVGREGEDSIHCIGADKLSKKFAQLVEDVNKKTVNMVLDYKYNDPNDPNRYYYRSDHYNYAKKGIPIVFFFDDMKVDYHQPTDDIEKINFKKLGKITTLVSELALEAANVNECFPIDIKEEVIKEEGAK
ncbi:MAG: M28 family peptidase [Melioribacteraceae bacterium]|nr:M28 family peptidase [Melioribacteraceae bacterium]